MSNLSTFYKPAVTRADLGLGTANNVTFGSIQNTPIGSTTASTVAATNLSASGTVSGTGFSNYLAAPPAIGNTTPAAGSFTTLNASGDGVAELVAQFGLADGISNSIQIWGNGAGRNQIIGAAGAGGLIFRTATGGNHCYLVTNATPNGVRLSSNSAFQWTNNSSNGNSGTIDLLLRRDDANILAQYNGASAQAFRLYNAFTSATNFERLNLRWASNELILDAEAGSAGGTLRGIKLGGATSSLLGFFGATPVVQQAAVADATDAASTQDRLNDLLARLRTLGLIAT